MKRTFMVPEVYLRIYARHGHRCPMSTLGGRLGLAVMERLEGDAAGLRAVYHARTCAVDGIAETTGCSEEAGTLTLVSTGRHLLRLEACGRSFEAALTDHALKLAGSYRALCDRLEQDWDQLSQDEQEERRMTKDAALDELLPLFWSGDEAQLVHVTER